MKRNQKYAKDCHGIKQKKDLNLKWFEHVIVFFIVAFYLFGVWMLWDIFYF